MHDPATTKHAFYMHFLHAANMIINKCVCSLFVLTSTSLWVNSKYKNPIVFLFVGSLQDPDLNILFKGIEFLKTLCPAFKIIWKFL